MILTATKRHDFFWEGTQSRWDQPGDRSAPEGPGWQRGRARVPDTVTLKQKSQNVGDRCGAWRHHTRVTSSVLVYSCFTTARCVPLLLPPVVYKNNSTCTIPRAPACLVPCGSCPLQACGLPSSSGFARQPPRPQRPCLASFLCPCLTQCSWQPAPTTSPAAGCGSPCSMAPARSSSTPVPIACLLTAPGICSKPLTSLQRHLLSGFQVLFRYIPQPASPSQTHFLRPSLWLRSQMWHLITKETLPCGEGQLLLPTKGGGKATFSLATDQCLVLPSRPSYSGARTPEGSAGLGRHPVTHNEHRSRVSPAANYRCWPNTGLENHYP